MSNQSRDQVVMQFVRGEIGLSRLGEVGIKPIQIAGGISWEEGYCPLPVVVTKTDIASGLLTIATPEEMNVWAKIIIGSGLIEFDRKDDQDEKLWDCLWDISGSEIDARHRHLAEVILDQN